ncbi:MAG: SPASM domain-containing protein [Eubacterium sp.]|nr:SPASM domain-containing protein [Eubacterium sp.]
MNSLTLLVKPAAGLCNMNCKYCFYKAASAERENRIMKKETVDLLIQRIIEYQPSALSVIFQGGEPTLAGLDFFKYFVKSVKEKIKAPVSFSLQTNGLLIDAEFAAFFKENNFLIGVSLDGNRRTNDRYRLAENGESVLPRVLTAISVLKKHKVDFNILSVIDNENAGDVESTYKYFKKHGFGFLQFIPYVDDVNGISLSAESYEEFLKKSFDLWYADYINGNYVSIRHIDNYIGILTGEQPESCAMCGVCGNYFALEADGSLYPCDFYCREEYKLGNISDENPFEMNEKQKAFIEQSLLIHGHCKDCEYYALCRGGCRRDRTDGYIKNKYCVAYKGFFGYAAGRMLRIAAAVNNK